MMREREEGGGAGTWRLLSAVSEAAIGEEGGSDAVGDVAMGGFEGRGDRSQGLGEAPGPHRILGPLGKAEADFGGKALWVSGMGEAIP